MAGGVEIASLDADGVRTHLGELACVLADCVAGGASVSFMWPYGEPDAADYFARVAGEVERGETLLFAARVDGSIVGTVQLGVALPPNQPHRADLKKLLVHRKARRNGIAASLLKLAEQEALARGRWLLVLDTVRGGDAERLYTREGWQRVGPIPDYALFPDGRFCDTVVFWKKLS